MKERSKSSSAALSLECTIHLSLIRASFAKARDMCQKAGLDFAAIDVSRQEENRVSDIDDEASERSWNDTEVTFMVDAVTDAMIEEDGPHFMARMAMYDLDNANLLWEAELFYQGLSSSEWGWHFEIGIKTDRDLHPMIGGRRLVFPKETDIELRQAMDVLKKMIEFFAQLPMRE